MLHTWHSKLFPQRYVPISLTQAISSTSCVAQSVHVLWGQAHPAELREVNSATQPKWDYNAAKKSWGKELFTTLKTHIIILNGCVWVLLFISLACPDALPHCSLCQITMGGTFLKISHITTGVWTRGWPIMILNADTNYWRTKKKAVTD